MNCNESNKMNLNLLSKTAVLVAVGLAGCSQTSTSNQEVSLTQAPSQSAKVPTPAEQACLAAVSKQTNNGEVALLSSEFSEAGTSVKIGVGSQRAPWNCIAYADGSTAEIRSLVDEGSL